MNLELSDVEAAALAEELANTTGNDRYPFSERGHTLKAILAKLRLEPVRGPVPPPARVYPSPRAMATRRWRLASEFSPSRASRRR
jgi:hypothetical protein